MGIDRSKNMGWTFSKNFMSTNRDWHNYTFMTIQTALLSTMANTYSTISIKSLPVTTLYFFLPAPFYPRGYTLSTSRAPRYSSAPLSRGGGQTMIAPHRYPLRPFPSLGPQSFEKNLIYPLCRRVSRSFKWGELHPCETIISSSERKRR